ncbi:hypothetical protein M427DRAFT_135200 [Gonapodya prolifera JEL478]|uniref:Autophagy protein 5 n=1 Tax=Gonapodya prolifera (strain JEL478) TaxID=1344416 RepID=A0A139AEQ7_GONPJ|nr:hypothetical protein M427DRAFT_135200 [Gonapodya prolifera JEL478]|eukprot:KXS15230.1 hypothetical protein M427DRAFT_135200 [Gonapodya prolifera JEL478]
MADSDIVRRVWSGVLPLEIVIDLPRTVHSQQSGGRVDDTSEQNYSTATYLFAPRVSYLPLLIPTLRTRMKQLVDPHARDLAENLDPSTVWFEADGGVPLKWHYPIGLLHDIHTLHITPSTSRLSPPHLPWRLRMKLERYPVEKIVSLRSPLLNPVPATPPPNDGTPLKFEVFEEKMKKVAAVVQDAHVNLLKESDFLRNGSTKKTMTLSRAELGQLWTGLETHDFDLFWSIFTRLITPPSLSSHSLSSVSLATTSAPSSSALGSTTTTDQPAPSPNELSSPTDAPLSPTGAQDPSPRSLPLSPRWVPMRAYREGKPVAQDLVPPYSTAGEVSEETTLLKALSILLPDSSFITTTTTTTRSTSTPLRVLIHGSDVPLEAPVVWLGMNMTYADGFVHVVVRGA